LVARGQGDESFKETYRVTERDSKFLLEKRDAGGSYMVTKRAMCGECK
jgi:hypothetical protein